jgi:hypothetical protein
VVAFLVVVVGVVVVVVVGLAADAELDDDEADVVGAVVVDVVALADAADVTAAVDCLATDEEWAVVSDATRIPRPMELATAAMPTEAVVRRTRDIARSRAGRTGRAGGVMPMLGRG